MPISLHGSYTSPFVRHCRIALMQSGLPWTFEPTDVATASQFTPAKRVPFLRADELLLTDSSVILQFVREKQGRRFLGNIAEAQRYHLANAVLDSAVNLFLLGKDGRTPDNTPYLQRQQARVDAGLDALAEAGIPDDIEDDSVLRIGCLVAWGRYRQCFTVEQPSLLALIERLDRDEHFAATAPPPA